MKRKFPLIGITTYEKLVSQDPDVVLAGLHVAYKDSIIAAGGLPILIPQNLPIEQQDALLDELDGIMLPGGGDVEPNRYFEGKKHPKVRGIDPVRDEIELSMARKAVARDVPLLAICRGHQVLNVAMGGTLWQDVETEMPDAIRHDFYRPGVARDLMPHSVDIRPNSRLANLLDTTNTPVNSIHHQGVRDVGDGLVVSATAPDGLVEGLEVPDHRFAVSVQWHPECIVDVNETMKALFAGFVAAA